MRELTNAEIAVYANRPGVRKIAVENFLGTMGTNAIDAAGNLTMDAALYQWNVRTVTAIRAGIRKAGGAITPLKEAQW